MMPGLQISACKSNGPVWRIVFRPLHIGVGERGLGGAEMQPPRSVFSWVDSTNRAICLVCLPRYNVFVLRY
jgi:hypothetical protein